MERCVVTGNSYGKAIHNTVSGQVWQDGEQFSVAITKQQCHGENEMTYGTQDGDPVSMGNDDTPSPSATTKASHTPAASEAPSTTSTHSTKTAKPKSHKTASHEPPTTTHKAPETNTNRPTDQDWLMTTCFSDSPNRAVYSHKIVQDNIDWIRANMKTVPRNPGKGNCTRLACHRNSAIFFCNDVGHISLQTPPYMLTLIFIRMETSTAIWRTPIRLSTEPERLPTLAVLNSTGKLFLGMVTAT